MRTKNCSCCKKIFEASTEYFYKGRSTYGLDSHCKSCRAAYRRAHPPIKSEATRIKDRERAVKYEGKYDRSKYVLAYRQNHPQDYKERNRVGASRRRARLAGAEGSYTRHDVLRIYKEQNGMCKYCGVFLGSSYHVDHVVPLSRGGSNFPDNIALACSHCNETKGNKLLSEWKQSS